MIIMMFFSIVCLFVCFYGLCCSCFEGMKGLFGMTWLREKVFTLLNKGLSGLFVKEMLYLIEFISIQFEKLRMPYTLLSFASNFCRSSSYVAMQMKR